MFEIKWLKNLLIIKSDTSVVNLQSLLSPEINKNLNNENIFRLIFLFPEKKRSQHLCKYL